MVAQRALVVEAVRQDVLLQRLLGHREAAGEPRVALADAAEVAAEPDQPHGVGQEVVAVDGGDLEVAREEPAVRVQARHQHGPARVGHLAAVRIASAQIRFTARSATSIATAQLTEQPSGFARTQSTRSSSKAASAASSPCTATPWASATRWRRRESSHGSLTSLGRPRSGTSTRRWKAAGQARPERTSACHGRGGARVTGPSPNSSSSRLARARRAPRPARRGGVAAGVRDRRLPRAEARRRRAASAPSAALTPPGTMREGQRAGSAARPLHRDPPALAGGLLEQAARHDARRQPQRAPRSRDAHRGPGRAPRRATTGVRWGARAWSSGPRGRRGPAR